LWHSADCRAHVWVPSPAITDSNAAASATVRAIGPTQSSEEA
jgi:hypothetical protein